MYDEASVKQRWKREGLLIERYLTTAYVSSVDVSRMYKSDPVGGVCSNLIWDDLYEFAACVVVIKGRHSCGTGRRYQYGQF